jgi:hypothetical protein
MSNSALIYAMAHSLAERCCSGEWSVEQAEFKIAEAFDQLTCQQNEAYGRLAQALKDYGQHRPNCQRGMVPYKCTCGLDAALTGAQA